MTRSMPRESEGAAARRRQTAPSSSMRTPGRTEPTRASAEVSLAAAQERRCERAELARELATQNLCIGGAEFDSQAANAHDAASSSPLPQPPLAPPLRGLCIRAHGRLAPVPTENELISSSTKPLAV